MNGFYVEANLFEHLVYVRENSEEFEWEVTILNFSKVSKIRTEPNEKYLGSGLLENSQILTQLFRTTP